VSIAAAEYRAGSAYHLVPVDRLTAEQRAAFGVLDADPDTYAVLIPVDRGPHTVKAIDNHLALVYLTLQEPGRLPSSMQAALGERLSATVTGLVLDGVLEIRDGDDFVCGPDAAQVLSIRSQPAPAQGRLAQLSIEALRYAQRLDIDDVRTLAVRLYTYNRHVLTPAWARRLPTREATNRYLGLSEDGPGRAPGSGWVAVSPHADDPNWLAWRSTVPVSPPRENPGYKLYVSPDPSVIADGFRITGEVLHKLRAPAFKVGADVHGLLRPDKLVAYFSSFEHLGEAAACLAERLAGLPAHGVPFTAEITTDGLLSWGIDPPRQERGLTWSGESWRLWVAGQLAAALLTARSGTTLDEPWCYALERIQLEGLDSSTWVPSQTLFAAKAGA
jgi:hypothetical protein